MTHPGEPHPRLTRDAASPTWAPHPAQTALLRTAPAPNTAGPGANCVFAYRVQGTVSPPELARAYTTAVDAFDALRLYVRDLGGAPRLLLGGAARVHIAVHDNRTFTDGATDPEALTHWIARTASRRFDLAHGPVAAIDIADHHGDLIVVETVHHALADGTSLHLLHQQLTAVLAGTPPPAAELGRYTDLLTDTPHDHADHIRYWTTEFAGFDHHRPRPSSDAAAPAYRCLRFDAARARALDHAARAARATLAGTILAALTHAVARYRGVSDLAVLVATDCRPHHHRRTFGQVTQLLPLRATQHWNQPLRSQAAHHTRAMLRAREHSYVDLDDLDHAGIPIALTAPDALAFVHQHDPPQPPTLAGAVTTALAVPELHHAGGLTCVVHTRDGKITLALRTGPASVDRPHLHGIADTVDTFLQALAAHPDQRLGADDLLAPTARDLARCHVPHPYSFRPVEDLILTRLHAPDAADPVLLDHDRTHTAHNLLEASEELLARWHTRGVRRGDVVIAHPTRTLDRVAAFLTALRLGAIYLPTTPPIPARVLDELIDQNRSVWTATGTDVTAVHHSRPARRPAHAASPGAPAYIIFTSGSTGAPKGVVVSRASLSNLVAGEADRFAITPASRILLIAPPTTDPWICHVSAALAHGATLVAADPAAGLEDILIRRRVTHAFLPAALVRTLDPATPYPDLVMIASAGDRCRTDALLALHRPGRRLFNIYGPTEATVTATVADLTPVPCPPRQPTPIGRPIRGMGARVSIDRDATAPPGVIGELMLTGAGIALGYLGADSNDRDRFRDDPDTGQRWYATGDRAWLSPHGELHFAGRIDRQVKIRGYRVELGEIEHAARRTGLCGDAVAIPTTDETEQQIVLYVDGCRDRDALRAALNQLPTALRPRQLYALIALPRTTTGAIDTHALAAQTETAPPPPDSATGLPRWFVTAWIEVLGTVPGPDSDFFASGADSLDVLRFARATRTAGHLLTPTQIHQHPIAADLAAHAATPDPHLGSTTGAAAAPHGPAQGWFHALSLPQPRRWNQQHAFTLDAILDPAAVTAALHTLLTHTPILAAVDENHALRLPRDPTIAEPLLCPSDAPDNQVRACLEELHDGIDPANGAMLRALVLPCDHATTMVLAAHHLVVDDWSWPLIEHRLRCALTTIPTRAAPRDLGYLRYTDALATHTHTAHQAAVWTDIHSHGRCADLGHRPTRLLHLTQQVPRLHPTTAGGLAPRLLAAFSRGLAHTEPHDTSIIDIERNGRTALPGVDLTDAVGWYALHHPLVLPHRSDHHRHAADIAATWPALRQSSLTYGMARWVHHTITTPRVGRFAVNITDGSSLPHTLPPPLRERLRRCAVALSGPNTLPYEGILVLRHAPTASTLEFTYDPERLRTDHACAVLTETARAYLEQTPGGHEPPGPPTG
ncbi:AMP-binding protein [Nocardia sp. NPDC003482]